MFAKVGIKTCIAKLPHARVLFLASLHFIAKTNISVILCTYACTYINSLWSEGIGSLNAMLYFLQYSFDSYYKHG